MPPRPELSNIQAFDSYYFLIYARRLHRCLNNPLSTLLAKVSLVSVNAGKYDCTHLRFKNGEVRSIGDLLKARPI